MKATGIVRKLDSLGRVIIPMELRRTMKLSKHDCVEFFTEEGRIVMRKYDATTDLQQILEDTERSIQLQDYMEPGMTAALISKLEEMKAIVKGGRK